MQHSAPTNARMSLVMLFTALFAVVALRSEAVAAFSAQVALAVAGVLALVVFVTARLKKNPQVVEWLLFLGWPLALVVVFFHPTTVMLAATLSVLKGLVAYFFGLQSMEGQGRRRLLFDLGLLPLARNRFLNGRWAQMCCGIVALMAALSMALPAWAHALAFVVWLTMSAALAFDLNCCSSVGEKSWL